MPRRTRARRRPLPNWRVDFNPRLRVFEKMEFDDRSGWPRNESDMVQQDGLKVSKRWQDGTRDIEPEQ